MAHVLCMGKCFGLDAAATTAGGVPVAVTAEHATAAHPVHVACGAAHSAITLDDGALFVFGMGLSGRLGLGTDKNAATPTRVSGVEGAVRAAACGIFHSACVARDGTLWTWGRGYKGCLGVSGLQGNQLTPVRVMGGVAAAVCAKNHTVIVGTDGALYTCGFPKFGRLGHGDTAYYRLPKRVDKLAKERVVQAAAMGAHTVVRCASGRVFAWGSNWNGRLGLGSVVNKQSPRRVRALDDAGVVKVAAGMAHSCALGEDGTVYVWGSNSWGQLGLGAAHGDADARTPVALAPFSDARVVDVVAGAFHTVAVCADGSLFAWGSNAQNELGLAGDVQRVHEPTRVPVRGRVQSVACGHMHTLLLVDGDE